MSDHRDRVQEEVRFRVLRLLAQNAGMSQRQLANAVGISTGGAHYVIKELIDKGLVKLGCFAGAKDKRRDAYVLTPDGIAEKAAIIRTFLTRKLGRLRILEVGTGRAGGRACARHR